VPEAARSGLHARVAASIQKLAPETGERRPEILARHYTEAGRPVEAIDYWHRAGRLAIQRSAHVDAIAHLTRALKLLETQPDDPRRAAQEVMVQLALANSLTATRGYAAPEVERTLARIRVVTERLGETAQQASVRWSLWRFYFARAEFRAAEELAHELLVAAERQNDDLLRVGAQIAAGIDKFYMGELARAREHFEAAVGLYDGTQSPMHTLSYGQDLGVAARGFLGWTQAMLGDLDGGVEQAQRAIALAREVRHPFSLVLTLLLSAEIHELRREPDVVRPLGEEMVALAREQSLTFYMAIGLVHSGWGQAAGGELDEGIAVMRQGAELYRSVGHRVGLAHRARMAEALIAAGALVEALGIVDEALAQSDETEERAFASELLRLQGEVRSRQGDAREARSLYGRALELAERQGAIVFALRASVALARVDPGARDTLGAILARFPRTADSSDLRAARAVLGEPR
jgi:predicted ATPase